MKVALIEPPSPELYDDTFYLPLGLLSVAAILRQDGHDVIVGRLDSISIDVDVVGFYCATPHYGWVKDIAKSYVDAKIPVLVGGPHPTYCPDDVQRDGFIPVIGEGELTTSLMLGLDVAEHRTALGRVIRPPSDLSSLPMPAYDLWTGRVGHPSLGQSPNVPTALGVNIIASRGCPYLCSFCANKIWQRRVRFRSVDHIRRDVTLLRDAYGVQQLRFVDDCFTLHKDFDNLCHMLKDEGMTWRCHSRANMITYSVCKMMKDCGCTEVGIGVESGSQKILNIMDKGILVKENKKAIATVKRAGLNVRAFMMIGFPGETPRSIESTRKFLEDTQPTRAALSTFQAYPGSDVWDRPDRYGAKIRKDNLDKWYIVQKEDGDPDNWGTIINSMTPEELTKARKELADWIDANIGGRDRTNETN